VTTEDAKEKIDRMETLKKVINLIEELRNTHGDDAVDWLLEQLTS
jgi:hypothetical protein